MLVPEKLSDRFNLMFCNKFKGCFANARQKLPAHIGFKLFVFLESILIVLTADLRRVLRLLRLFVVVFGFFWQILIWII